VFVLVWHKYEKQKGSKEQPLLPFTQIYVKQNETLTGKLDKQIA
jgi:hypothetical protein